MQHGDLERACWLLGDWPKVPRTLLTGTHQADVLQEGAEHPPQPAPGVGTLSPAWRWSLPA